MSCNLVRQFHVRHFQRPQANYGHRLPREQKPINARETASAVQRTLKNDVPTQAIAILLLVLPPPNGSDGNDPMRGLFSSVDCRWL